MPFAARSAIRWPTPGEPGEVVEVEALIGGHRVSDESPCPDALACEGTAQDVGASSMTFAIRAAVSGCRGRSGMTAFTRGQRVVDLPGGHERAFHGVMAPTTP